MFFNESSYTLFFSIGVPLPVNHPAMGYPLDGTPDAFRDTGQVAPLKTCPVAQTRWLDVAGGCSNVNVPTLIGKYQVIFG